MLDKKNKKPYIKTKKVIDRGKRNKTSVVKPVEKISKNP